MTRSDNVLIAAIALSLALHAAALFGTPRFDLGWLYEELRPAPVEAMTVVRREPPAQVVAAKPTPRPARKPAARPRPQATPAHQPEQTVATSPLDPPSPDGDALPAEHEIAAATISDEMSAIADQPVADQVAEEKPPVEYPLKQARLVFDLYYGESPIKVGQVTHTWTQDGRHYEAESVAEAVGLVSLFFSGRFVQRSIGQFGAQGLRPEQYTLERGRGAGAEVARFDWPERRLALAWKNASQIVELPAGAQDPLSSLHQLYFARPLPASASLAVATSRRLNRYVFTLVGEETLETPLGTLRTLQLRRREPDGTTTQVWLDLDRNLLPARIHAVDRKGNVLDQVIREAQTDTVEPAEN